jgi:nitroreductase
MNRTLEILKERRTTRKFKSEQLKDEEIEAIIEAGLYAPSAHNQQSWHFTVIQNKELIKDLNTATKNELKNKVKG